MHKLHHGKQEDILKDYPENHFDSCPTDPPYGLKFMGQKWDYQVPTVKEWESVYRVLKPGAFLLAFGGTRTYHRLTCNIEDAGFEIRDMMGWLYGSGFPKSHNITDELGTALKPAIEPICLARKPLEGTVQENYNRWGTGVLNIEGCRIPSDEIITNHARGSESAISKGRYGNSKAQETHQTKGQESGRWPANIQHDGSEEVMGVFPKTKSGNAVVGTGREGNFTNGIYGAKQSKVKLQVVLGTKVVLGDFSIAGRHRLPIEKKAVIRLIKQRWHMVIRLR